jgi:hypothetical protein
MKHLRLVLAVSFVAFIATFSLASADSYDSEMATIQKKSASTAKVSIEKSTYTVPVTFGDGASWDNVKDHYELSDASGAVVKSKHASLTVNSDGSVNWAKKK